MRIIRIATPIVAALCGLFVAAPASAQPSPYPPGPPKLTVRPAVVEEGDVVTVKGRNFGPFDRITIRVRYLNFDDNNGRSANNLAGTQRSSDPDGDEAEVVEDDATAPDAAEKSPAAAKHGNHHHSTFVKTVQADARGRFTTHIRLKEDGVAKITAIGRPSGIRASARVFVLCDEDEGHHHHGHNGDRSKLSSAQPAPKAATVKPATVKPATVKPVSESTTVESADDDVFAALSDNDWLKATAGALGGLGFAGFGAALRW